MKQIEEKELVLVEIFRVSFVTCLPHCELVEYVMSTGWSITGWVTAIFVLVTYGFRVEEGYCELTPWP